MWSSCHFYTRLVCITLPSSLPHLNHSTTASNVAAPLQLSRRCLSHERIHQRTPAFHPRHTLELRHVARRVTAHHDRFYAWVEGLNTSRILRGTQPLMEEGKLVSGAKGSAITDGAFAESKEAIAGYFLLALDTMAAASRSLKPVLSLGTVRRSKCGPSLISVARWRR